MVTKINFVRAVNDEISGGIGPVNWLFCSIVTSTMKTSANDIPVFPQMVMFNCYLCTVVQKF